MLHAYGYRTSIEALATYIMFISMMKVKLKHEETHRIWLLPAAVNDDMPNYTRFI